MSRVLVTGGSGLIGRRTVAALIGAGHEVHATTRGTAPADTGEVTWHQADLLTSTDVVTEVRADVLVHLAWNVEHGSFWTSPDNERWRDASLPLLERFARAGGRRAVLAGTCAEYDWTTGDGIMREGETLLRPATLYGRCKDALRASAEAVEGIDVAWGRVFFLYAPDEAPTKLFGSVARALLAGERAETTPGTQVRDFLHVDDVGGAFAALAESAVTGAVNIGSGEGVQVRELVEEIGAAVGRPELLAIGARPAPEGEPPVIVAGLDRLADEVGFVPHFSLRRGVRDAVRALTIRLGSDA
ncbi:MAG: NAD(P)-dependent oxidoreductase [Solirubrobacteraceae bacterium]|nr:NAD(P)-dependent oxidoreductase [Solirubrobacteraceae bacterium]